MLRESVADVVFASRLTEDLLYSQLTHQAKINRILFNIYSHREIYQSEQLMHFMRVHINFYDVLFSKLFSRFLYRTKLNSVKSVP